LRDERQSVAAIHRLERTTGAHAYWRSPVRHERPEPVDPLDVFAVLRTR